VRSPPHTPQQNTVAIGLSRNNESESSEEKVTAKGEGDSQVARALATGGLGAVVGGVAVGVTMMKLGANNSSDVDAQELDALKNVLLEMSVLELSEVNEDTLRAAIAKAIDDAKVQATQESLVATQESLVADVQESLDEVNKTQEKLQLDLSELEEQKSDPSNGWNMWLENKKRKWALDCALAGSVVKGVKHAGDREATLNTLENQKAELVKMGGKEIEIRNELDYYKMELESEKKQKETLKEVLKTLALSERTELDNMSS